jgi:hypothetical protein
MSNSPTRIFTAPLAQLSGHQAPRLYLPLLGALLVAVLVCERLLLCRVPPVRDWLGLRAEPIRAAPAIVVLFIVLTIAGCGPSPVRGGTRGILRIGGTPMSEVQVTVYQHQDGRWQPIGLGVAMTDGSLELVTSGAQGPLTLEPGEYRCTLESIGAPVRVPREYSQAETTPLAITWSSSSEVLSLEVPGSLLTQ